MASFKRTAPISSIAMALAGQSANVNIPKPSGNPEMDAVARSGSKKGLPTPPNSISPTLPPHAFVAAEHEPLTPPGQVSDSDIDLQDAVEHAAAQDRPRGLSKAALDATGNITPTLLATHHLPEILLEHGPLAIRYIMGYLTTSVPGFAGIAPNKARRLVVAALEGRGNGEGTGGLHGEVIFEKVGWGRWDARRHGQPSQRSRHTSPVAARHVNPNSLRSPSPYSTSHPRSPYSTSHTKTFRLAHRPRNRQPSSTSLAQARPARRHETDADQMSMDGDHYGSGSYSDDSLDDEEDDDTDEEDWTNMSAAALRAGASFPKSAKFDYQSRVRRDSSQLLSVRRIRGVQNSALLAKSAPAPAPALTETQMKEMMQGVGKDEQGAIEALLSLGSM